MNDDAPDLGPCCGCQSTDGVTNIVMLPRRNAVPGHGWGCLQCGLPSDGAVLVLCDRCFALYRADETLIRFACRGYPATEGRIPIADLPESHFDHDDSKHPELQHHDGC